MGQTVRLADGIFWVGAVDWNLRHFHGPSIFARHGTTYNAYLIDDARTALVDTVHAEFAGELLAQVKAILGDKALDYLVVNHTEKDHSGAFPALMRLFPQARVLCTQKGLDGLKAYYPEVQFEAQVVKSGDRVSLGRRSLTFLEAPMLHWPDSMFTYVAEEALLLPNDAFGQNIATSGRFDDEVDDCLLMDEAAKYFANILMPYSALVLKKLEEVEKLGIAIRTIGPSHGVIWRQDPGRIISAYARWAEGKGVARAIIAYDTMWQATEKMALAILDGLVEGGVEAKLLKASSTDRSDIIKEILEARAILVGSPTMNNDILPVISPILDELAGLRPRFKVGAAFGSYGWGGGAQKILTERLKAARIDVLEPGVAVQWSPKDADLERCRNLGREVAARIKD